MTVSRYLIAAMAFTLIVAGCDPEEIGRGAMVVAGRQAVEDHFEGTLSDDESLKIVDPSEGDAFDKLPDDEVSIPFTVFVYRGEQVPADLAEVVLVRAIVSLRDGVAEPMTMTVVRNADANLEDDR